MVAPTRVANVSSERFDRREAARWKWTNTAHDRLAELGLDPFDVYAAILQPLSTEPGMGGGTQIRRRGNVAAVVDPESYTVITVMDAYGTPVTRRVHAVAETVLRPRPVYPDKVVAAPEPARDEDEPWVADPTEVKNMAARIRMLGKAAVEAGEVPAVPKRWLMSVCLPRMWDYPGRWARIICAPYPSVAEAMAQQIKAHFRSVDEDVEITVRGPHIYGRST